MNRLIAIGILCVLGSVFTMPGLAQGGNPPEGEKKGFDKSRLIFGGDVALSFGLVTVIGASPILGYRITDKYSAGIGGTYFHFRSGPWSSTIYGANLWNRFLVNDFLFLQAEYHRMNVPGRFAIDPRVNIDMLYVGGGYRQRMGQRVSLVLTVLYDVIDDPNSPFTNPMIRGGIIGGF